MMEKFEMTAYDWKQDWVKPHFGLRVEVYRGRKHAGKTGYVVSLQQDRFYTGGRYGSPDQNMIAEQLRNSVGRDGFIVMIDPDQSDNDGKRERFFVKAEYIRPIK